MTISRKSCRTELSRDGKFLYATCWNPGSLVVFARDPMTGNLTHVQTIGKLPELLGATGLRCPRTVGSPSSAAFQSKAVVLFRRNQESGKLTQLDVAARSGQDLEFPIAVAFSPDGKFVCIADDGGKPGHSGVRVYKLAGEKLIDAGMDLGRNRCYSGARGLAFHPDGKALFVACCLPGSLVVADFNPDSGAIKVRQVLWAASKGGTAISNSDVGAVAGIAGLIDVVSSPDGRFVTTCSGRFGGTTAVTSFKFGDDGHLAFASGTKSSGGKIPRWKPACRHPGWTESLRRRNPLGSHRLRGPRPEKRKSLAQRRHFRRRPAGRSRQDQEPRGRHHQLRRPVRLCRDRRQERHLHIPAQSH